MCNFIFLNTIFPPLKQVLRLVFSNSVFVFHASVYQSVGRDVCINPWGKMFYSKPHGYAQLYQHQPNSPRKLIVLQQLSYLEFNSAEQRGMSPVNKCHTSGNSRHI